MAKRKKASKHVDEKQLEQLESIEAVDATANDSDDTAEVAPSSGEDARRVNFNMPQWLIDAIDKEARHLAIPRQSVVIMWLADRARQERLDK